MKKTAPFLLLIILFTVAGWYFFTRQPDAVHELLPPQLPPAMPIDTQQPEVQLEEVTVYREPEPVFIPDPLPVLNKSDPEVKQKLAEIIGADPLAEYLVKSEVISRIVATIDSLTSRQVPAQINPVKPAGGKLMVENQGERVVMSAQNFARYDGYVALMRDLHTEALVMLYQRYYPLFQQAWEENGGEGSFNERLLEVIDQLLETPDIPGFVYLTKPEAVYLYEEPALEEMAAGQKILVRMGSVNAAVVKEALRELRVELSR